MLRLSKVIGLLIILICVGACTVSEDGSEGGIESAQPSGDDVTHVQNPWDGTFDAAGDPEVHGEPDDVTDPDDEADFHDRLHVGLTPTISGVARQVKPIWEQEQFASELIIYTAKLKKARVGKSYTSNRIKVGGGVAPYTWSATGLPEALSLEPNGSSARIKGTLECKPGTYEVHIVVTDSQEAVGQKTFSLVVGIDETLMIRASQFEDEDGEWQPLEEKYGMISAAAIDSEARRVRLEVVRKEDLGVPTAPELFWTVESDEDAFDARLGLFIPPIPLDALSKKLGQVAYLMPWDLNGTAELATLALLFEMQAHGGIEGVRVRVHDGFGNEAQVEFGSLEVAATHFQKCFQEHYPNDGMLQGMILDAPEEMTKGLDDVKKYARYEIEMHAKGGVLPYTWTVDHKATDGEKGSNWDVAVSFDPNCRDPMSDRCTAQVSVSALALDDPSEDPSHLMRFRVSSCGGQFNASQDVKLVALYPHERVEDLSINIQVKDINDTDGACNLIFHFYQDDDEVAAGTFALDPLEDIDDGWDWVGGSSVKMSIFKAGLDVTKINRFIVQTTDSCDGSWSCGEVDVDVHTALFWTPSWDAEWCDDCHDDLLNDDEGNATTEITGQMTGAPNFWRRYAGVAEIPDAPIGSKTSDQGDCDLTPEQIAEGWSCL